MPITSEMLKKRAVVLPLQPDPKRKFMKKEDVLILEKQDREKQAKVNKIMQDLDSDVAPESATVAEEMVESQEKEVAKLKGKSKKSQGRNRLDDEE